MADKNGCRKMISHYNVSRMKSNKYRDADAAPSNALCIGYYEKGNDKQALSDLLEMCSDAKNQKVRMLTPALERAKNVKKK